MLFSELHKITLQGDEDWFDPILTKDTCLFIDPFSVFKSTDTLFENSYSEMMYFFQQVFELIAHAGGNISNLSYKKAEGMLLFPEVNALCLGYSKTRRGSGSGPEWAKILASNINSIIAQGITNITHFEELGIFCEGIGPDRLSDMTANLLKSRLITYTQRICHEYNIPMTKKRLQNSAFDYQFKCWNSNEFLLPTNPYKNDSPVLLVPKDFLNLLPEINSDDFEDTIQLSERLRNDFNYEVDKNLDKNSISQIAIEHYDLVKEYINIVEKRKSTTFAELMRKTLRYTWYELSKGIVENNKFTFSNITNEQEFLI